MNQELADRYLMSETLSRSRDETVKESFNGAMIRNPDRDDMNRVAAPCVGRITKSSLLSSTEKEK